MMSPFHRRGSVTIEAIVLLTGLALSLIWAGGVRLVQVQGRSMEPAIGDGALMVAVRQPSLRGPYRKGDVVLVQTDSAWGKLTLVKRIGALPGDSLAEFEPAIAASLGPNISVPEGKVYVVGDNAEVSLDSRMFGPLDEKSLRGKCLPLEEFLQLPMVFPSVAASFIFAGMYVLERRRFVRHRA